MRFRNDWIDILRAVAIVLMVIFHFIFDLTFFGYTQLQIPNGPGWREFRAVIVSLFLITMGASLLLAYPTHIQWRKLWLRSAKLLLAAAAITAVSLLITPAEWIYFGILHFIALASWLCIGLRHYPKIALWCAGLILLCYNLQWLAPNWPFSLIRSYLPAITGDFVAPVPWLAAVCLGIWLSHQRWFAQPLLAGVSPQSRVAADGTSANQLNSQSAIPGTTATPTETLFVAHCQSAMPRLPQVIRWLSQHSLAIYLLHQPLFFAGFYLLAVRP